MTYSPEELTEFLEHSNFIEGVYGFDALEDAQKAWDYLSNKTEITVNTVLEVHRLLLQRLDPDIAGKFREVDVFIGGQRKKFMGISILESKLQGVLDRMNVSILKNQENSDKVTKDCHIKFEDIHPHEDGNGRTGRILYNWHRLQLGLPVHIIHEGEEQHLYYKWFR